MKQFRSNFLVSRLPGERSRLKGQFSVGRVWIQQPSGALCLILTRHPNMVGCQRLETKPEPPARWARQMTSWPLVKASDFQFGHIYGGLLKRNGFDTLGCLFSNQRMDAILSLEHYNRNKLYNGFKKYWSAGFLSKMNQPRRDLKINWNFLRFIQRILRVFSSDWIFYDKKQEIERL